jgi:hypothetical protein
MGLRGDRGQLHSSASQQLVADELPVVESSSSRNMWASLSPGEAIGIYSDLVATAWEVYCHCLLLMQACLGSLAYQHATPQILPPIPDALLISFPHPFQFQSPLTVSQGSLFPRLFLAPNDVLLSFSTRGTPIIAPHFQTFPFQPQPQRQIIPRINRKHDHQDVRTVSQ